MIADRLVTVRDYAYRELGEADSELLQKAGIEAYVKRTSDNHAALMVAEADAARALDLLGESPQLLRNAERLPIRCPRCLSEQVQPRKPYWLIALIAAFGGSIIAIQFGRRDAAAALIVAMAVVIALIELRMPRYRCMSCYQPFRSGATDAATDH